VGRFWLTQFSSQTEELVDSFQVPAWVRDAVFYQIFPDRFANSPRVPKPAGLEPWEAAPTSHGFKGGDLLGVIEHLDYLADLGVNGLYFTPVFQSTANHRYHTFDYLQVDPILGGDAALRLLLDEAHRRGMRVVLDGVFNHASRGFFQFNHILENGRLSPYYDWFHIRSEPLYAYDPEGQMPGYDAWWGLKALPKFNVTNPEVREFIFRVAEKWLQFGIDGWRLDVPGEIDDNSFWQEFRQRVKRINPDAYIVGEVWHPAERWLEGDQFDGVMNYQFMLACIEYFIGARGDSALTSNGYGTPQPRNAPQFAQAIETLLGRYPQAATGVMLNLLDSHDTPRFLTMANGDEATLRMAYLCLMTYPGAPSIYYGDEIGMTGGKDPANRAGMIWDEQRWNQPLLAWLRTLIGLRRAHPALRWGTYTSIFASGEIYACSRAAPSDFCVVVFNAGETGAVVNVPVTVTSNDVTSIVNAFDGTVYPIGYGKINGLQLAARSGVLLTAGDGRA
jgi:neopullulanase